MTILQFRRKTDKVKKNPYKQMTLALPIDTDRQNLLAGLRHSSLVRDDSGKHRIYRDEEQKEYEARDFSDATKLLMLRDQRDIKLAETDWVVIKEREEGGSVSNFADWKKYRQELRDITNTYKSLEDVKWPTAPSE